MTKHEHDFAPSPGDDPGLTTDHLRTVLSASAGDVEAPEGLLERVHERRHEIARRRRGRRAVGAGLTAVAGAALVIAVWPSATPNEVRTAPVTSAGQPADDGRPAAADDEVGTPSAQLVVTDCLDGTDPTDADPPTMIVENAEIPPITETNVYAACVEQLTARGQLDGGDAALAMAPVTELDTAPAIDEPSIVDGPDDPPTSPEADTKAPAVAPPRFVVRSPAVEVTEIVDSDGGVVSIFMTSTAVDGTTVVLNVVPGSYDVPDAGRPLALRRTTGHARTDADGTVSVVWQEQPDLALELAAPALTSSGSALDIDSLVVLAEAIVELDADGWNTLRAASS